MGCVSSSPEKTAAPSKYAADPSTSDIDHVDQQPQQQHSNKDSAAKHKSRPDSFAATSGSSAGEILHGPTTPAENNVPVSKLRTDCKLRDVYQLGKVLGTGGFSIVKLAIDKQTGIEYACKIMALPAAGQSLNERGTGKDLDIPCENTREDIFKEIDILCGLNHENILFLKEYFEEQNKVYLITELLTGGELLDAVLQRGSYNENEARVCFSQLLKGIEYLHSKGVVHRDLKLENLLLQKVGDITVVKIADFGLAKMAAGEAMQTVCGTPQYVAPEVIMGLKSTQYGPGVDMWGAGVVLFILLGGYPPFYSESEPQLFEQIRKGKFNFDDPVWKGITNRAKDLIRKLLIVDPARRLTASQALNHIWFASGQVDAKAPSLTGTQVNLKKHFSNRGPAPPAILAASEG